MDDERSPFEREPIVSEGDSPCPIVLAWLFLILCLLSALRT